MPLNFLFCSLEPFLPQLPRHNPFVLGGLGGGLTWTLTSAYHVLILCDLDPLLSPHDPRNSLGELTDPDFFPTWGLRLRESFSLPALGSSLAPDAGNSKLSHFLYFIYLKAFPNTSVQKTWLAHIFSKTIICGQPFFFWEEEPRLLPLGLLLPSDWYLWTTHPLRNLEDIPLNLPQTS